MVRASSEKRPACQSSSTNGIVVWSRIRCIGLVISTIAHAPATRSRPPYWPSVSRGIGHLQGCSCEGLGETHLCGCSRRRTRFECRRPAACTSRLRVRIELFCAHARGRDGTAKAGERPGYRGGALGPPTGHTVSGGRRRDRKRCAAPCPPAGRLPV